MLNLGGLRRRSSVLTAPVFICTFMFWGYGSGYALSRSLSSSRNTQLELWTLDFCPETKKYREERKEKSLLSI
jgi:hypothetical protein